MVCLGTIRDYAALGSSKSGSIRALAAEAGVGSEHPAIRSFEQRSHCTCIVHAIARGREQVKGPPRARDRWKDTAWRAVTTMFWKDTCLVSHHPAVAAVDGTSMPPALGHQCRATFQLRGSSARTAARKQLPRTKANDLVVLPCCKAERGREDLHLLAICVLWMQVLSGCNSSGTARYIALH